MKHNRLFTACLPSKNTQSIPSNYNVGAKCHQRDVQVRCIDILDWRFVGQPSSYWFSYSCPVTLKEDNKCQTYVARLHKMQNPADINKRSPALYPVQEREQDDLQFVPHILAVDLKVVLRVRQILCYLTKIE